MQLNSRASGCCVCSVLAPLFEVRQTHGQEAVPDLRPEHAHLGGRRARGGQDALQPLQLPICVHEQGSQASEMPTEQADLLKT